MPSDRKPDSRSKLDEYFYNKRNDLKKQGASQDDLSNFSTQRNLEMVKQQIIRDIRSKGYFRVRYPSSDEIKALSELAKDKKIRPDLTKSEGQGRGVDRYYVDYNAPNPNTGMKSVEAVQKVEKAFKALERATKASGYELAKQMQDRGTTLAYDYQTYVDRIVAVDGSGQVIQTVVGENEYNNLVSKGLIKKTGKYVFITDPKLVGTEDGMYKAKCEIVEIL